MVASGGATAAAAAAGGDGTAVVVSVLVVVVDAPQCPARLRQACFGRYRDPLAFLVVIADDIGAPTKRKKEGNREPATEDTEEYRGGREIGKVKETRPPSLGNVARRIGV